MAAREEILERLRAVLNRRDLRFPPRSPELLNAATRMTVTRADGTSRELAHRFGQELETLHGAYEIVDSVPEARLALINRLLNWMAAEDVERKGPKLETGQERCVLSWAADWLPVPGLYEALADLGLELVSPGHLHTPEDLERVRHIRFGLTGVEAAIASTGSLIVVAGDGTSRAASFLPLHHIALVPFSRLYPTVEAWLAEQRSQGTLTDLLRTHGHLAMITGPSKSADIEMNLTLGVHGPKFVHALLFDA